MQATKSKILGASVMPLILGTALAAGAAIPLAKVTFAAAPLHASPTAGQATNPTAVARGQQPDRPRQPTRPAPLQLAACNPCGGKKTGCGACNPCAAIKSCSPCAAKKACGGCNPCAAKKACNPCGAKSACGGCSPCGG